MFKFLGFCFVVIVASVSAKPHLLTTGVSYATPAVVTHPVVARPVVSHAVVAQPVVAHAVVSHPVVAATAVHTHVVAAAPAVHTPVVATAPAYYPNYAVSYATYPQLVGAAHFVRLYFKSKGAEAAT
ncbi:uncharacterized protein ACRADG_002488 isoform 2-T2 [Cochliomyia hominivorax]